MSTQGVLSGFNDQVTQFQLYVTAAEQTLEAISVDEYEQVATPMIMDYSSLHQTLQQEFDQSQLTLSVTEKDHVAIKLRELATTIERIRSKIAYASQYLSIAKDANATLSQPSRDSASIASLNGRITALLQNPQVSGKMLMAALDLQGLLNTTTSPRPSLNASILSTQIGSFNPFQELKAAFDSDQANMDAYAKSVKTAFDKLSREQKMALLGKIAEVMKKPAIARNTMFLDLDFLGWLGTPSNKRAALALLAPPPVPLPSAILATPPAAATASIPVTSTPDPIPLASPPTPPANLPTLVHSGLKTALRELIRVIPLINSGKPTELKAALGIISTLTSLKCVFPLSGVHEQPIITRLYFHLYFIHRNANKHIPPNENDYGRKAFNEEEIYSALPSEKIRAVQRTIAEVALEGIRQACLKKNPLDIRYFLDQLERNVLDLQDRLKSDQANFAHTLFGLLWDTYNPCYERDKARLCNPRDAAFRGDFGRVAFRDEAGAQLINNDYKLQALTILIMKLKTSWKIS